MLPRKEPLPLDAIRDLLGLVRAIYRSERLRSTDTYRLAKIAAIGVTLQHVLEIAADQPEPGSRLHQEAWREAEQACQDLPQALDMASPHHNLLNAARGAVMKSR